MDRPLEQTKLNFAINLRITKMEMNSIIYIQFKNNRSKKLKNIKPISVHN